MRKLLGFITLLFILAACGGQESELEGHWVSMDGGHEQDFIPDGVFLFSSSGLSAPEGQWFVKDGELCIDFLGELTCNPFEVDGDYLTITETVPAFMCDFGNGEQLHSVEKIKGAGKIHVCSITGEPDGEVLSGVVLRYRRE